MNELDTDLKSKFDKLLEELNIDECLKQCSEEEREERIVAAVKILVQKSDHDDYNITTRPTKL